MKASDFPVSAISGNPVMLTTGQIVIGNTLQATATLAKDSQFPVAWSALVPAGKVVRNVQVFCEDNTITNYNTRVVGPATIQLTTKDLPGSKRVGPGLPVGGGERRELPLPLLHELSYLVKEPTLELHASTVADYRRRVEEAHKVTEYIEHILEMSRIVSGTADRLLEQLLAKPGLEIQED